MAGRVHGKVNMSAGTVWPSGLRRWLQAPVRKGVGSNAEKIRPVLSWARAAPWNERGQRAVLGIEPRTSRTRSENHATRPKQPVVPMHPVEHTTPAAPVNLMALLGSKPLGPAGKAARTSTPASLKNECSTVCRRRRHCPRSCPS